MKPWTDLKLIAKPARVAALPVDERGYPIPYFAAAVNGKPDFRVIDPGKWTECVMARKCAICGRGMGTQVSFVGGPQSLGHRVFNDAAMHKHCAEYALRACPMLAAPSFAYNRGEIEGAKINPNMSTDRPERFGLGQTVGYNVVVQGQGYAIKADSWISVEWWQNGERVWTQP